MASPCIPSHSSSNGSPRPLTTPLDPHVPDSFHLQHFGSDAFHSGPLAPSRLPAPHHNLQPEHSLQPEQSLQHEQSLPPEHPLAPPPDVGFPAPHSEMPDVHFARDRFSPAPEDDFERALTRLAADAAPWSLAQLAHKIKLAAAGHNNDPFLAAISSPHDSKHDRAPHVFGLVWLQRSCERAPAAVVPRTRVYARYVQRCADLALHPLAPALFGRLVRVAYPNLKTRRLGVRGKSKYHYCGLRLVDERTSANSPHGSANSPHGSVASSHCLPGSSHGFAPTPHGLAASPHLAASPRFSPLADSPSSHASPSVAASPRAMLGTPVSSAPVPEALPTRLRYVPGLFTALDHAVATQIAAPLTLPTIYPYLAKSADVDCDVADTLHSLYRVHCSSLFDSMRYMDVDRMFALFRSFPTILTAPVTKLLVSEPAAAWVRDCDLATYRAMAKMVARLHSQHVPAEVLRPLQRLAAEYADNLATVLQSKFPAAFAAMKLSLARQFVSLLRRLVRCIETGVSAARILANETERRAMLQDWLRLDMNDIVLRELPCALDNPESIMDVLETRLPDLFDGEIGDPVLGKYAAFLFELPARFPGTNPWLFSLVCSNFLTTCLREMSLCGAPSFGSWWLVRCWVDEYLAWFFELGGYLFDDFRGDTATDYDQTTSADTSTNLDGEKFVHLLEGYGVREWAS